MAASIPWVSPGMLTSLPSTPPMLMSDVMDSSSLWLAAPNPTCLRQRLMFGISPPAAPPREETVIFASPPSPEALKLARIIELGPLDVQAAGICHLGKLGELEDFEGDVGLVVIDPLLDMFIPP